MESALVRVKSVRESVFFYRNTRTVGNIYPLIRSQRQRIETSDNTAAVPRQIQYATSRQNPTAKSDDEHTPYFMINGELRAPKLGDPGRKCPNVASSAGRPRALSGRVQRLQPTTENIGVREATVQHAGGVRRHSLRSPAGYCDRKANQKKIATTHHDHYRTRYFTQQNYFRGTPAQKRPPTTLCAVWVSMRMCVCFFFTRIYHAAAGKRHLPHSSLENGCTFSSRTSPWVASRTCAITVRVLMGYVQISDATGLRAQGKVSTKFRIPFPSKKPTPHPSTW